MRIPVRHSNLGRCEKASFTDKTVLRDTYPYGLFAVPLDKIIELHASSGTTGKPSLSATPIVIWMSGVIALLD